MLELFFYMVLFLVIYSYVFFPALLYLMGKFSHEGVIEEQNPAFLPSVAIVCAMYNEEKVVADKIKNFELLKYDNIRLYIGSDGSNDKTKDIVQQFNKYDNIKFFDFPRRGKVYVINDLMSKVEEDIIIFTDANSMFKPDAVINLIKYFTDSSIGAVCGKLNLVRSGKPTGEGFYWRYETMLKKMESKLNCVVGANGAIYAIRRELLEALPANTINDDFTNSMRVITKGYGIKYADDVEAFEEINHDDSVEFKRHVRDGAGHYRAMIHLYKLLNPLHPKVLFLYVSHRVIRWLVPFLLVLLIVLPLFFSGANVLTNIFVACEMVFYLLVLIGCFTGTKQKLFYIPYYFIYINIALLIGFFKNILGMQKVTWNSTKR